MASQNKNFSQQIFQAFNSGDVQTILSFCSPESEFLCPGPSSVPYTGSRRGIQEIIGFFTALGSSEKDMHFQIEKLLDDGDTVVAIGSYHSIVIGTGKAIETPLIVIHTWKDGKVARTFMLADTAHAAEAHSPLAGTAHT